MKKTTSGLLIILFALFTNSLAAGDGWPQPKGNGYLKLAEWWLISNQHYTDQGKIDPNITTALYTTSIYAEYGFTEQITGVVYFPFFSRSLYNNTISATTGEVITPGEAANSLGDLEIGLRYRFTPGKRIALSASLTFGIPTGMTSGGELGILQTGDGEFNQLLKVDIGTGFTVGSVNAYSKAYFGFNNRTNDFSDEIHFGVELGGTFFEHFFVTTRLYGVNSLMNGLPSGLSSNPSLFANNSEHLTFSVEAGINIGEQWGISAGFQDPLSGSIVFANTAYTVGVFTKF